MSWSASCGAIDGERCTLHSRCNEARWDRYSVPPALSPNPNELIQKTAPSVDSQVLGLVHCSVCVHFRSKAPVRIAPALGPILVATRFVTEIGSSKGAGPGHRTDALSGEFGGAGIGSRGGFVQSTDERRRRGAHRPYR